MNTVHTADIAAREKTTSKPKRVGGSRASALLSVVSRIYRNWPVHNLIGHPMSEIAHWLTGWLVGSRFSGWIHDVTVPPHEKGTGRG